MCYSAKTPIVVVLSIDFIEAYEKEHPERMFLGDSLRFCGFPCYVDAGPTRVEPTLPC